MTQRVLGPTGSRRRRRLTFGPTFVAVLLALMFTAGAQAVHLDNLFELDGNAVDGVAVGEDWDKVFAGTDSASVSKFVTDGANASIFTGGGSKDDLDVDQWQHTDGSVPDKDDLLHGYAARYGDNLYFGADRFAGNGDAQIGIWFFQNDVTPLSGGTFGPGLHRDGDILVLSDFTKGGDLPTVRVFEWNGPGGTIPGQGEINGTLHLLFGTTDTPQDCVLTPLPATDPACATVNASPETAPWTYTPKDGPEGSFPPGHFYEGGIDLGFLGVANECFSSFLIETRSSQSVDAVLKDFVSGQFNVCQAEINTTPSSTSIVLGQSVTDTAVVTGKGVANPPTPTGTVKFFICSPAQLDANGVCSTGGTQVGTPPEGETLSEVSPGTASATSESFTPTSTGTWCWRGEYVPAAGSPYKAVSDFDSSECLTVTVLQPQINTSPSSASIVLGQSVTDHAQVDGTAAGGSPAGTVKFFICSPAQLDANGVCSTGGTQVGSPAGGETLTPIAGTNSSQADSESFTPTSTGTWCWRGEYVPAAGSPYLPATDSDSSECLTVTKLQPQINTSPSSASIVLGRSVTDHAVVDGTAAGGPPTGTVKFFICSPTELDLSGLCGSGGTQVDVGGDEPNGETLTPIGITNSSEATSDAFTPTSVGKWCWRGEYSGDDDYLPSTDADASECLEVITLPTETNTTPSSATIDLGQSVTDHAVVAGSAAGGPPAGTVKFFICSPRTACARRAARRSAAPPRVRRSPRSLVRTARKRTPSRSLPRRPGPGAGAESTCRRQAARISRRSTSTGVSAWTSF